MKNFRPYLQKATDIFFMIVMVKVGLFFACLILGFITLIFVLTSEGFNTRPDAEHDSDAHLIQIFEENRASFDQLLSMIQEDEKHGLTRYGHKWTVSDEIKISPERLATYRTLLEKIGCINGFENNETREAVYLFASSEGWAFSSGSSKSYYFPKSERKVSPLVEDLDAYRRTQTRSFEAFRPITGNWYLCYDYND